MSGIMHMLVGGGPGTAPFTGNYLVIAGGAGGGSNMGGGGGAGG